MTGNTVEPICVGVAPGVDKGAFLWGLDTGTLVDSPSIIWLVKTAHGVVVVDAGSGTPEWVSAHHRPFTRTADQDPRTAVEAAGVSCDEVRAVVLTHLHYDHCQNLALFPNATIYVNRLEVGYACAPFDCHEAIYEAPRMGYTPSWMAYTPRMHFVDGDLPIVPGVTMIHLPGHSLGHSGVIVEAASGPIAIVGDHCALFDNWFGRGSQRHIPSRTYVDLREYYASFTKLEQIGGLVLPGHEMRVFEKSVYS
jgi:glyoxylase-like metal-dependent hydrolase (beta-lactamase superfamily II)